MPTPKNKKPLVSTRAPAVRRISVLGLLGEAAIIAFVTAVLLVFLLAGTSVSAGYGIRDVPAVFAIIFAIAFIGDIALLLYVSRTATEDQHLPPEPGMENTDSGLEKNKFNHLEDE